jgi:hypothetical protein
MFRGDGSSPPDDLGAAIREALNNPAVRAEIAGLLTGEQERRQRRLAELAAEIRQREITIRLEDDENRETP